MSTPSAFSGLNFEIRPFIRRFIGTNSFDEDFLDLDFDRSLLVPIIPLNIDPSNPPPGKDQAPIIIAFLKGVLKEGRLKPL